MKMKVVSFLCVLATVLGCAKNRDSEIFLEAYDNGDAAYANGTIEEAEAGQLRFRELSYRALETNAKYVNSRETIWLSNFRLFSIYTEMGESEKAQRHLLESYEYFDKYEQKVDFKEYTADMVRLVQTFDGEIKPRWKRSNQTAGDNSGQRDAPTSASHP